MRIIELSLKSRVALAVAALFVVSIGVQTWLTLRYFTQEYRQVINDRLFEQATMMAADLDQKLQTYRDMVIATAGQLPLQALDDPELAQRFLDQQAALKAVLDNGLLLVSEQGRIIADSRGVPGLRGRDVRQLDIFQGVSATRAPYISRPFTSLREGRLHALSIGAPIFDAQGRMVGRLHGSLDLHGKNFLSELSAYTVGRTGYVGLATGERLILVHQDKSRIMQRNQPGQNALVDRAIEGFEGSGRTRNAAGVDLLTSVKHLKNTDWILVVNMPVAEAEEPLRRALWYMSLGATALALLVLALAWLIMQRALAPLATLTRHVRELPTKRGTERLLALRASGEIATLVRAFNEQVQASDRQQEELKESEARFRSLAEMSTDWFWEQDELYRFTQVSQGFRSTEIAAQLGKTRWEQATVAPGPQEWELHRQLLDRREPFSNFIYQLRDSQGRVRTLTISGTPIFDEEGVFRGYRGVGSDISDRRAAEQRIEYLAYHDALTGLPNRLLVQDRFEQAMAQAERSHTRVALVYLDLDNFKTINDTLGHAAGDEFLKEVAQRLRDCVRDSDTISRQGGDEFLLVLRDLPDTEIVSAIVIKIMERLQEPLRLDTQELSSSASIGVAIGPDDGHDFETLRKKADLAMYRSKEAGRNAWHFFDPTMDAEAGEHLLMRNGLRRALERQEFVLYYQPQYELASGVLTGVEALIRWQHPELGLVAPARFIGVAEESGLIVSMGDWVLRQACQQAMLWQRAGLPALSMSVNLSAIQFKRGNVEQSVENALSVSGLAPELLELELTESILIQNTESVLTSVRRLKQLGVKLAIDDFGTGYSSLSYLKRLDIDKLKIDQSFVRDLATDPDDAAIVRAIIQMARSLNLQTIAEGVETEEMRSQLRAFGCDAAQGYLYSRPVPAQDIERLLRQAQTN